MKVPPRDIENYVKNPNPSARVILIYGPDNGLMKERAKTIGLTITADLNDPFNAVTLSTPDIIADPARLADEAGAISMMGGDRLIRITSGGDKLTPFIKSYLENPNETALITIEAGELNPRSSLRKLCETAPNAAAIPCYVEDQRDLARLIQTMVAADNLQIDQDAIGWLAANINGDRTRARSEIEKLILYKNPTSGARITIEDAMTICGASGTSSMDDLTNATASGNSALAIKNYQKLMEEGISFIAILRSLQNHFKRLHQASSAIESGTPADQAMKTLQPPIFFKNQTNFRNQLQRWRAATLIKALGKLADIEADCKKTGAPAETLCAQTILGLSKMRG